MSVLDADVTMRFWTARLLPFELLLPPTRFSARLVSASLLVAFVHLVRGPWDLHLRPFGRLHCQRGPFYVWMGDAESIDQGDPSATDEERQLRKRRLINGPQEFRDIRSNRAKIKG